MRIKTLLIMQLWASLLALAAIGCADSMVTKAVSEKAWMNEKMKMIRTSLHLTEARKRARARTVTHAHVE